MKIVDAHNHPDWLGFNLERVLANMDANGIAQTWLLAWECGPAEYSPHYNSLTPALALGSAAGPVPFSRCVSYAERAPGRFIRGYCPDPRLPDACDRLEAAHRIFDARVCGELKCRMMYDNPDALRLFRLAGELKMPVVFHLEYDRRTTRKDPWCEWWGGTLDAIERMLQACPDTVFLGHAPGFWAHISGDDLYLKGGYPPLTAPLLPGGRIPALMRSHANLYCDLSAGSGLTALSRDRSFTAAFISEFQDRLLFGRDGFDNRLRDLLESLTLDRAVLAKVLAGNAERLLAGG
jgi:predicted TIM-barrel fold metal-dependent hydrolase